MPLVKDCFFLFNLKPGTLVIVILGLIIRMLCLLYALLEYLDQQTKNFFSRKDYDEYGKRTPHSHSSDSSHSHSFSENLFFGIVYAIVCFIVCILIVVGIFMKKSGFFIPYLIFACLEAIICVIVTVTLLVFTFTKSENVVFGITFGVMLGISVIVWYAWLCVFSFYKITGEGVRQDGIPPVYYSAPGNYPQQANYPPATMPPPAYQEKSQFGLA